MKNQKSKNKPRVALVFGSLPNPLEVDQFRLIASDYDISVVSTQSICGYLRETSRFKDLECLALPDHEENPTYVPGLENVLADFDIVVVKERLGLYSYQAVKAKWKHRYRLVVWIDNLATLPAEDISQMRTIRSEVVNAADLFLVQSKTAAEVLMLEGVQSQRIAAIGPYVEKTSKRNKKNRSAGLKALGLPEDTTLIGHIGQIEWEEGLIDLAGGLKIALEREKKRAASIRLIVCGIGSFATQFKQTLIALGVDEKAIFVAPNRDAIQTILNCVDAIYFSHSPSRDRVEGDPYRIVLAMANEIPVISNRSPIVEETCGKNRLDVCFASASTVADILLKVRRGQTATTTIVNANNKTVRERYSEKVVRNQMLTMMKKVLSVAPSVDESSVDHQVVEAESLVASKQYLKAIDLIESVFKVEDIAVHHKANLFRLIGDCFAKLSDNEGAKNAYIKAIELDSFAYKAFIGLGTVALVKQSNDIAVLNFQKAVSLAPQDEMANLGLGLAFVNMEEREEATNWILKALEINPYNTVALYTLVKVAYERNEFQAAEASLKTYLKRHGNDHNILYTLGGVQFRSGKYKDVIRSMKDIIRIDPMDNKALALMKQAERAMQQKSTSASG